MVVEETSSFSLSYYWHISFIVKGIVYITDYKHFIQNIIVEKMSGQCVSNILGILYPLEQI